MLNPPQGPFQSIVVIGVPYGHSGFSVLCMVCLYIAASFGVTNWQKLEKLVHSLPFTLLPAVIIGF